MRINRIDKPELWRTVSRRYDGVQEIVEQVRGGGDQAVLRLTAKFDKAELRPGELQVPPREIEASLGVLEPEVVAGLRTAIANVRTVAEAQLRDPIPVELPQGHRVEVTEVPVRRVGLYAPGGEAVYPSTVVMGAVTARVAGVDEIAVCAPPGPDGRAHPAILAACVLCEVNEVYRMGGAQAIAALAYGTESLPAVDVIAGPGKLVVIASEGADPQLAALDLLAQAEHGRETLVSAISPDAGLLDALETSLRTLLEDRPSVTAEQASLIKVRDVHAGLRLAEQIAPEHLELVGTEAEALADNVRVAGCVFVGAQAGTAFGDYVAGSNHVLPTGRAARFQSALSPATFRRRMARVSLPGEAAARLAPAGAALARAEGFPVHAESMERRA